MYKRTHQHPSVERCSTYERTVLWSVCLSGCEIEVRCGLETWCCIIMTCSMLHRCFRGRSTSAHGPCSRSSRFPPGSPACLELEECCADVASPDVAVPSASAPGASLPGVQAPDAPGAAAVPPYTEGEGEVSALLPGADLPGSGKLDPSMKVPDVSAADVPSMPDAAVPSMPDAPALDASAPPVGVPETSGGSVAMPHSPTLDVPSTDAPSASLPGASATLPGASATLPGASATLPGASAALPGASGSVPAVDVSAPDAAAPGSASKKKSKFSLPSFMSPSSRKAKKEGGASGKLPLMAMGTLSLPPSLSLDLVSGPHAEMGTLRLLSHSRTHP